MLSTSSLKKQIPSSKILGGETRGLLPNDGRANRCGSHSPSGDGEVTATKRFLREMMYDLVMFAGALADWFSGNVKVRHSAPKRALSEIHLATREFQLR